MNVASVIPGTDPTIYHLHGESFKRGDPMKVMSRSELKKFAQCPRRWLIGTEEDSSDALDFGALVDCIALTPERFEQVYTICPTHYTAVGKKKDDQPEQKPWNWNANYCKEWREQEEAAGKIVVKSEHSSDAWTAVKRLTQEQHIADFLKASRRQVWVNVEWHDEETGLVVPVKCLLDLVPDPKSEFGDTLADLKTTCNASYRAWCKQVFNESWHTQAALYLDAYNIATGLKYRNFEHIISESFAPYEPTHRMLSSEFLQLGRHDYQEQLKDYCRCLKTGNFRGYDCAIAEPESWMLAA